MYFNRKTVSREKSIFKKLLQVKKEIHKKYFKENYLMKKYFYCYKNSFHTKPNHNCDLNYNS